MKLTGRSTLLGALALFAAACGSDDDSGDTTAAPDGGPASEAPATEAPADSEAPQVDGRVAGDFASILLPKCTGIAVFDQANEGAIEAAGELGVGEAEFVGPATCTDSTGTGRVRDQRRDPGRRRHHDLQQRRRPDRPGHAGGRRRRHHRRELGLADPVRRRREPLRGPGRLRRDRQGDGRHGHRDPRGRGRRDRHPVGIAGCRQPERVDRVASRRCCRIPSTPP